MNILYILTPISTNYEKTYFTNKDALEKTIKIYFSDEAESTLDESNFNYEKHNIYIDQFYAGYYEKHEYNISNF